MDVRGVVSLLLGSLLLVISACSGGEPREVTDDEGVAISTQSSPTVSYTHLTLPTIYSV